MAFVAAPYLMAALLLGAAGAAKAITPSPATDALTRLGVPNSAWSVRILGLLELTVATGVFISGGILPASALAGLYSGFTVVSVAMLRNGPGIQCGCFGRMPMPASSRHVIVNLVAVTAGVVAATWPTDSLTTSPATSIDKLFETDRWLYAPFAITVVSGACGVFLWLSRARTQPQPQQHQGNQNQHHPAPATSG